MISKFDSIALAFLVLITHPVVYATESKVKTNELEPQTVSAQSNENSSDKKRKTIMIPFGYYTPETKLAVGGLFIDNFNTEAPGKTSSILSSASLTVLGQSIFNIVPRFYFDGGKKELGALLFYSYFPSKFYGLGLDGTLDEPESFLENTLSLNFNGGINFYGDLYLRGVVQQDSRKSQNFDVGGRFDTDIRYKNIKTQFLTISLESDARDYPQAPTKGHLYRITRSFYGSQDQNNQSDKFYFTKTELEFKEYLPIRPQWILAQQIYLSLLSEDSYVPFQYLNSIGGSNRLRGFYNGRYRAKQMLMYQSELRYDWKDRWVLSGFVGAARLENPQVGSNSYERTSRDFASGGLGVHYIVDPQNRTKFRFDIGFGAEKLGVYFIVGEAF